MHFYQALQFLLKLLYLDQGTYPNYNEKSIRKLGCYVENCIICSENNDQVCDKCNTTYIDRNGLCEYNTKDSNDKDFTSNESYLIAIIVGGTMFVLSIILCFTFYYLCHLRHIKGSNQRNPTRDISRSLNEIHSSTNYRHANIDSQSASNSIILTPVLTQGIIPSGINKKNKLDGMISLNSDNFNEILPIVTESVLLENNDTIVCTICFEDYSKNRQYRITPCQHIFHSECIYSWLITNNSKTCPNDNFKFL
ncbi:hypothetical protein SteCoe_14372 [Stentor coeruleus]|uniref:RING-type domain-containing protein n=1 Tax=Stentor coeruleus TaxID=5963 RepID=A0A1R2C454_9CILI|nr:hypothetical protein SteCoe_15324 [Stentor coeruleus]OMJ84487.1 hypothetical protein SteCoe_14372 [Stentor coeruleus]